MMNERHINFKNAISELHKGNLTKSLNRDELIYSKHLYHFTDIRNATSILKNNKIYSRKISMERGIMANDNASAEVILGTDDYVTNYVRLYFRPKTPTQYRNEGIMSKRQIIESGYNAHCPIPVFFLFDSVDILSNSRFYFSNLSLASHSEVELSNTVEDFLELPFDDIFHSKTLYNVPNKQQIISRRHAEVVTNGEMDLSCLTNVVVRSIAEKEFLLFLLRENKDFFSNQIAVDSKKLLYNGNRAYLISVALDNERITFSFNYGDTKERYDVLIEIFDKEKGGFFWKKENIYLNDIPNLKISNLQNYDIFIFLDDIQIYGNSYMHEFSNVPF